MRTSARLGFNEQRELASLPGEIERLMAEIAKAEAELAAPAQRDRNAIAGIAERLAAAKDRLGAVEERWLELEARREAVERKEGA